MSNELVGGGCIHEKQTERDGRILWDVCPFCQIQTLSEEIARLEAALGRGGAQPSVSPGHADEHGSNEEGA